MHIKQAIFWIILKVKSYQKELTNCMYIRNKTLDHSLETCLLKSKFANPNPLPTIVEG